MLPNMRDEKRGQSLAPFLDWVTDVLDGDNLHLMEIGCFAGDGTIQFIACDEITAVTCIDLYKSGYDENDTASSCDMKEAMCKWSDQVSKANVKNKSVSLLAWQTGFDAINLFDIDICYIDASHLVADVIKDIRRVLTYWKPKVIAGHDYGVQKHPGVKAAVDTFFRPDQIETFPDSSWAVVLYE